MPRWAEDPETEVVCAAIRHECAGMLKGGRIGAECLYAELHDAEGMLVGLKSLRSTGCRPLDEHLLLDHRHFATVFSEPGKPDLEGIAVELAPGVPKQSVLLIKRGSTEVSIGC